MSHSVPASSIFVNTSGRPIKFRIQQNLDSSLEGRLEGGIKRAGGRVIPKVPIRGIVVIDPESHSGCALVAEWAWSERPKRQFVSYEYVLQCIDEGRMLPPEEHDLIQKGIETGRDERKAMCQAELSEDAKGKLALYLSRVLPYPSSGNRSSNLVYKDLVKKRNIYTWLGRHPWQAFRDQYCKNKRYYDRLIKLIVDGSPPKPEAAATKNIAWMRKKFVSSRKENGSNHVLKVALPFQSKHIAGKVKFEKRSFADDLTNLDVRENKRRRTIQDMIREPLPRIEIRRARRDRQDSGIKHSATRGPELDLNDIEVGRANERQGKDKADFWVDTAFKIDSQIAYPSIKSIPQTSPRNSPERTLLSQNFDLQHSLSTHGLGLDDLRSAAALDASLTNDEAFDADDEGRVVELLGLSKPEEPSFSAPARPTKPTCLPAPLERNINIPHTNNIPIPGRSISHHGIAVGPVPTSARLQLAVENLDAVNNLARETRFSMDEILQKMAGFSGDLSVTCEFFRRCRNYIEDQYARAFGGELSVSVANLKGGAGLCTPCFLQDFGLSKPAASSDMKEVDLSQRPESASFPAKNTRAKTTAHATKKNLKE